MQKHIMIVFIKILLIFINIKVINKMSGIWVQYTVKNNSLMFAE